MTHSTHLAQVIAGLTKAQRDCLLWCNGDGSPRVWPKGAETSFYCLADIVLGDPKKKVVLHCKLVQRGESKTEKRGYWPASTWAATPLGLAVRTALLHERNDDDCGRC